MQTEPFGYTQFTYTRDQLNQLVELYRCNDKRISSTLVAALNRIFPRDAWLPVLEFIEKIADIDRNGPGGISRNDITGQWMALALDPKLNPKWLELGSESNVQFCFHPDALKTLNP